MNKNDLKKLFKSELVELIILKNLNITKKELFFLEFIEEKYIKNILKDIERLKKGEPIEYILEKANFFGNDFFVDSRVLIPRNDTEIMIEKVLEIKNLEKYFFIDVGTGSSAIICSIFINSKAKKGIAIDISKDALKVAEKNLEIFNLKEKIKILENDLLANFENLPNTSLTSLIIKNKKIIITANLPYIKNGDFGNMSKETILFEPNLALFGGEKTGFELYEKLIGQCQKFKKNLILEELILFIEIGFDQKIFAENFLKSIGLKFEIFKDNSKIDRCIKIYF